MIHGDHGSRITETAPLVDYSGSFSDQDVIASYSTLFAIRFSSTPAGYEPGRIPLHSLMAEFIESGFTSVSGRIDPAYNHTIILEDRMWNPVQERDLPTSWLKP